MKNEPEWKFLNMEFNISRFDVSLQKTLVMWASVGVVKSMKEKQWSLSPVNPMELPVSSSNSLFIVSTGVSSFSLPPPSLSEQTNGGFELQIKLLDTKVELIKMTPYCKPTNPNFASAQVVISSTRGHLLFLSVASAVP